MQQLGLGGGGFGGGKGGMGMHPLLLSSLLGGGACVEPTTPNGCTPPNQGTDLCGMDDSSGDKPCCECSAA